MNNFDDIKSEPIGVFDSGIGGLTVLSEIQKVLPSENVIYIGDEAHFPYGEKSREQIIEYSLEICDKLVELGAKMIVIACNTITAAALDSILNNVDVPVVGVIDAGVDAALSISKNASIGVLATQSTIDSKIFEKKLKEKNASVDVTSVAAPKLVEFVEHNIEMVQNHPSEHLKTAISQYCKSFKEQNCDTVIMACTHFPPLEPLLQEELGSDVSLVSPSKNTAEEVLNILTENNLLNVGNSEYKFYTTGPDPDIFKQFWTSKGTFEKICV